MTGQSSSLDNRLLQLLACPWDHSPLEYRQGTLTCTQNHQFHVEQGISVLTKNPRRELVPWEHEDPANIKVRTVRWIRS